MNNNRIEAVKLTTPVGIAKFPNLVSVDPHPEYGGDYSVQLLLDNETPEAQEFVQKIEAIRDEMHKQMQANMGRKKPWNTPHFPVSDDLDQDGEESGNYNVRLKSKGSYERGGQTIERKVNFFDAQGAKIENPAQAFGGDGQLRRVATLLPDPAPVAARLLAGHAALLAEQDRDAGARQKERGRHPDHPAADHDDIDAVRKRVLKTRRLVHRRERAGPKRHGASSNGCATELRPDAGRLSSTSPRSSLFPPRGRAFSGRQQQVGLGRRDPVDQPYPPF